MLDESLRRYLRSPGPEDNKYTRGVLGVVTGSKEFLGAAVLSVGASARTGVGMVRYVGPAEASELVLRAYPEVVLGAGKVDALLLGCGVAASSEDQIAQIRAAAVSEAPKILDAGALAVIDWAELSPLSCILTPHAGELARLLDSFAKHVDLDYEAVQLAALLTNQIVLLKGHTTLIATPDGGVRAVGPNPAVLATAGTGDVLAGIMGGLLAANAATENLDLVDIAALAVEVHSECARRAATRGTVLAHDLIAEISLLASEWQL